MHLGQAVIVERAAEARANDKERRLKEKEQERARCLAAVCSFAGTSYTAISANCLHLRPSKRFESRKVCAMSSTAYAM